MKSVQILQAISHRPWPLPKGTWRYYQEWNNALFLHWKVSASDLAPHIPAKFTLDTFHGESWISLVAFTMEQIRPQPLPSISFISNFHEINVRTYLTQENKQGVYFLNIEAAKALSVYIARGISGLPYEKAYMTRHIRDNKHHYQSRHAQKGFQFEASFLIGEKLTEKSALDHWLTERYCVYLNRADILYRYEVHHTPWELYQVEINSLLSDYRIGDITLNRQPDLVHYSTGVKVLAWPKEIVKLK